MSVSFMPQRTLRHEMILLGHRNLLYSPCLQKSGEYKVQASPHSATSTLRQQSQRHPLSKGVVNHNV